MNFVSLKKGSQVRSYDFAFRAYNFYFRSFSNRVPTNLFFLFLNNFTYEVHTFVRMYVAWFLFLLMIYYCDRELCLSTCLIFLRIDKVTFTAALMDISNCHANECLQKKIVKLLFVSKSNCCLYLKHVSSLLFSELLILNQFHVKIIILLLVDKPVEKFTKAKEQWK